MESQLGVKSVIGEAWEILKKQAKFFLIAGLIMFVGQFLLQSVSNWLTDQGNFGLQFMFSIIQWAVQMYVGLIMLSIGMRAVKGNNLSFNSILIQDFEIIKRYVWVSMVYGLIVAGGVLLLIVPGIIWGLQYSLSTYLAVDKGMKVKEALAKSKQLTAGNRWKILLIGLALLLINILGAIPFGLGVIITAPLSLITGAVIYLRLSENMPNKGSEKNVPAERVIDEPVLIAKPKTLNSHDQYHI